MLDEARHWAETQDGRPWGCKTHPPSREHHGGDRPGPGRELAATTGLARQHQGGVPAVRLWGGHPHGRHGSACRAVPRRGGAASDRPHGPRRHDPRFLSASHAQGGRPRRRRPRHRVLGSQLSGRAALGRNAGPRPPDDRGAPAQGLTPQTRASAGWSYTVETIGRPPDGTVFVSVADRGADVFAPLESVREAGWDAVVRAARERRLVQGGGSLTALRAARAMGASTISTKTGAAVVCVAWRELELLPPRNGPRGRTPIRVRGVRVWNDRLEWLLLTTRPIESLEQALEIVSWYTRRWIVAEFHKAWTTGCRAEERRLTQADRLVPLLGALAIVAVRLLTLRDAARRAGTAPADAPAAALKVLAAKLQRPAECFASNRAFLRGVAQLGGFLARTSDGEPGWQTLWKSWSVLMTLVEGYELAQTITSANRNVGNGQPSRHMLRTSIRAPGGGHG